jgi:hypothetical protein
LQNALRQSEPPLVIGEIDPRMVDEISEPRPPRDDKVLRPQRLVRHVRLSPETGEAPARKSRPFAATAQSVWPRAAKRLLELSAAGRRGVNAGRRAGRRRAGVLTCR